MASPVNPDRPAWLEGPPARCEVLPQAIHSAQRLVLLGAPGVGKGTQAALLHSRLGPCHLSTGDIFRTAGRRPESAQTPAIRQALAYMRRGELVPDSTVLELVRERRPCLHCPGGFILDGFPRTVAQAESLKKLLEDERLALTAVINYDLPAAAIVQRLAGRRTCSRCKAVYHVTERPSKVEERCDLCHGSLFQREDDRPESIRVRLEAYDRSTAPLIAFYQRLGLLVSIDAAGTAEEMYARTLGSLRATS
ncbi:MAG TPA: nucleoside monophosphate kinase [Candidatus Sulfotelmatobacter sp.]|nr:nucleoside monophosphate kinase [Candidatus Sulfotelmatobacter sp.]